LGNSFYTMVADSGSSNYTTSDAGNLIFAYPPHINDPSSIIVGNRSSLLVTSVDDMVLPRPFYLNYILVTPDIFKIFYLFAALLLTIDVLWSLTILVFL
jgi:hypothetical protein